MAKQKDKRNARKRLGSHDNDATTSRATLESEVECHIAAIKAMSDFEIEHLLTRLRLVRTFFNEEQLKIPALKFFKESLPNVSVIRNGGDGNFDLRWADEIGNFSLYNTDGRDMHASLHHRMSLGKSVKTEIGNFFPRETFDCLMIGLPTGPQTPGVDSQRLSIGMTPKTSRLPKQGEMLLSVNGSPLGVYNEDNMESIRES